MLDKTVYVQHVPKDLRITVPIVCLDENSGLPSKSPYLCRNNSQETAVETLTIPRQIQIQLTHSLLLEGGGRYTTTKSPLTAIHRYVSIQMFKMVYL